MFELTLTKNKQTWSELSKHAFKSSLDAFVAKVEVHPLCGGQTENRVELGLSTVHQVIAVQHIIITNETHVVGERFHSGAKSARGGTKST